MPPQNPKEPKGDIPASNNRRVFEKPKKKKKKNKNKKKKYIYCLFLPAMSVTSARWIAVRADSKASPVGEAYGIHTFPKITHFRFFNQKGRIPMKKNTIRGILAGVILLIVFHVITFAVPFVHKGVFWVSYVFGLVSFGVLALGAYLGLGRGENAKSKFYGFPIARLAAVYFAAQMALGFVLMAIATVPLWLAAVLYVILLGAAGLGMIGADAVVEEIHRQDVQLKQNVGFMRDLQSKVNQMAAQCADPQVKRLAEDIRYSDPVSSAPLEEIERDLSAAVDDLQAAIADSDSAVIAQLAQKAGNLLAERNRLCKLNK